MTWGIETYGLSVETAERLERREALARGEVDFTPDDTFAEHGPSLVTTWAGERPFEGEEYETERAADGRVREHMWRATDGPTSWELVGLAPSRKGERVSREAAIQAAVTRRRLLGTASVRRTLAKVRERERRMRAARERDRKSRLG